MKKTMPQRPPPSASERRLAALAYALWDAENSVRMVRPADVNEHLERAQYVELWLGIHGFTLRRKPTKKPKSKPQRRKGHAPTARRRKVQ